MAELRAWQTLAVGGAVAPVDTPASQTGGWRTGLKPAVDTALCVNCLLCWLYCPDSAVSVHETTFSGIDLEYCKGCEICAEVCPVGAIAMVEEASDAD
jgi:2-oxoacid:acceptor oxidoreductase delta subunit (pyruvate/2-ketoisovalerate family)